MHPVDLGKVCQTLKLQLVICDFLELDEKKERLYHIMMCYVESRSCPFTVVANKTKLRKK